MPKRILSSDCSLQLDYMKPESLVIAGQHTAVNVFLSLVHTARQATKAGGSSPNSLPTLYMSASACRMFAAIVVVIIYCLLSSNRDSILFFVVTFLIYYFVILIYDTWYFVKIEKKIKNNV